MPATGSNWVHLVVRDMVAAQRIPQAQGLFLDLVPPVRFWPGPPPVTPKSSIDYQWMFRDTAEFGRSPSTPPEPLDPPDLPPLGHAPLKESCAQYRAFPPWVISRRSGALHLALDELLSPAGLGRWVSDGSPVASERNSSGSPDGIPNSRVAGGQAARSSTKCTIAFGWPRG